MHVFVDESKAGAYLLVAGSISARDVAETRGCVRALHLPRQTRLHMAREDDSRRRTILDTFERLGVRGTIYRAADRRTGIEARGACVDRLVRDLVDVPTVRVTFECDTSQDERDRRQLYRLVRELGCRDHVQYEHRLASSEPLLAVPDAIGWAFARGGDFRRRARPLIAAVIDV